VPLPVCAEAGAWNSTLYRSTAKKNEYRDLRILSSLFGNTPQTRVAILFLDRQVQRSAFFDKNGTCTQGCGNNVIRECEREMKSE